MSEQKRPTPPAGPGGPSRQPINTQDVMNRMNNTLDQLGIDRQVGLTVLIVALVSGVLAALLDRILDLPSNTLVFTLGALVAALNGPIYAFLKGKESLAAAVMSAVTGAVALLAWYLATKILGDRTFDFSGFTSKANPSEDFYMAVWVTDEVSFFEALLTGVVVGLLSYGWFAGLRRLPRQFLG